jgi:hypothetical protein
VRQRVKRGTLDSIKVGGSLFVLLDNDTSPNVSHDQEQPVSDRSHDTSRLVETLEGEVAYLRRQLDQANERDSENRRIIAALTQRIPELEAASEARDGSESASPRSDRGAAPEDSQEGAQRRSWLYRFFFGP